jgi:E3 ubiquitin-protein ligase SHPRH
VLTSYSEINHVRAPTSRDGKSEPRDYVRVGKNGEDHFLTDILGHADEQFSTERRYKVHGSWGTKIEAVVCRLKWLIALDPNVKCLVFSEWEDVLDVVSRAIAENCIKCVRAESGPKFSHGVDSFKRNPECNVLLMPLKRGAQGLNLTEAQHVLLLEPVLDPGLEAQAIKRVDRIGQTRATCVHRFMIRGTIEENIYKFSQKRANEMNDLASDISRQNTNTKKGLTLGEVRALVSRPTSVVDMIE